MAGLGELIPVVGVKQACRALNVPRASFYRWKAFDVSSAVVPPVKPAAARALGQTERTAVLACLHEERFQDSSPAAVYATMLDEGHYHCSIRTTYRILDGEGETRERRDQIVHPVCQKPELLATAPNQLWSWDITKLLGPVKWTYFYLYVILDIFSRYVFSSSHTPSERRTSKARPITSSAFWWAPVSIERAINCSCSGRTTIVTLGSLLS